MNKLTIDDLAYFGGNPLFNHNDSMNRNDLPDWNECKTRMQNLFNSRWYTNQGPLAQEIESRLQNLLNMKHVIGLTNGAIAFTIALKAKNVTNEVIIPSWASEHLIQPILWAGASPIFCQPNKKNFCLDSINVSEMITAKTQAIIGVNIGRDTCELNELSKLADKHNIPLIFDSSKIWGAEYSNFNLWEKGDFHFFSLNQNSLNNFTDAAFISTNDDNLAANIRNIRSSYGAGKIVNIGFTGNGRMSEAQALSGLIALDCYKDNKKRRTITHDLISKGLANITGINIQRAGKLEHNAESILFTIDEEFGLSSEELYSLIRFENINIKIYKNYGVTLFSIILSSKLTNINCINLVELFSFIKSNINEIKKTRG